MRYYYNDSRDVRSFDWSREYINIGTMINKLERTTYYVSVEGGSQTSPDNGGARSQ